MSYKKNPLPKGRPETLNRTELTTDELKIVEEHSARLTVAQLADYLGMERSAFSRLMDKQPEVGEAFRRGKAAMLTEVASVLVAKALAGDTTAMIFLLKTQGGWCEKQKIEHSGEIGARVTIFKLPDNGRN